MERYELTGCGVTHKPYTSIAESSCKLALEGGPSERSAPEGGTIQFIGDNKCG